MTIQLSIVMPCHNRFDALRLTLESLCRQTFPADQFEVIVVDQASTDGSREVARTLPVPYDLRLVEQDAKYGISVARNAGIQSANSHLVLLLDADLVACPGTVGAHVAQHEAQRGAIACGRVLPYPPAYRSFVERSANPDAGLDRGDQPRMLGVQDALGGHMSFSIETFHQVGPFDPSLRGFEDIDFAYRAQRLGHAILYCPEAISYHNHPRTIEERMEQARSYNRMVPGLLERHPELRGALPGLREYEALDVRRDRGDRLWAKLRARLYAAAHVRVSGTYALSLLERRQALPRLAKALYWRLLAGHRYLGFRQGIAK